MLIINREIDDWRKAQLAKYLIIAGKNISKWQLNIAHGLETEFINDPAVEDDKAYLIDHERPMLGLIPLGCRRCVSRIS